MIGANPNLSGPVGSPLLVPGVALVVLGGLIWVGGMILASPFLLLGPLLVAVGVFVEPLYNWFRGRGEREDLQVAAAQLAAMVELGMPLDQAFSQLGALASRSWLTCFSRPLRGLAQVGRNLAGGERPGAALDAARCFPAAWGALLDRSGTGEPLHQTLRWLSEMEGRGLPIPPMLVVRVLFQVPLLVGIPIFLRTYILPTFEQLGAHSALLLPVVVAARILGVLAPVVCILALLSRFAPLAEGLSTWFSRLPGIWPATRLAEQAWFCQVAGVCCRLGMPVPEILATAAAGARDPSYRKAFERGGESSTLARFLTSHPDLFEARLSWLAARGETLGNLDQALSVAAGLLQDEHRARVKRVAHWLDLTAVLLLGVLTALTCAAVFSTMSSLLGSLLDGLL